MKTIKTRIIINLTDYLTESDLICELAKELIYNIKNEYPELETHLVIEEVPLDINSDPNKPTPDKP